MKVYFRTCEKDLPITFPRLEMGEKITKTDILKKCWLSLQDSVSDEDELIVIYDEISSLTLSFLNDTANSLIRFYKVPKHKWNEHLHTIKLFSILEQEMKNYNDSDWIYIVEDDYLHSENALNIMRDAQKYWGGFMVPYELPSYYIEDIYSKILIGETCHWRTVHKGTMTTCARVLTIKENMEIFKKMAPRSNDTMFETIYKDTPCICPLPGVASHLAKGQMTPIVDWFERWENV